MSSKRSVVGTGGTRESIGAVPPDPGARSGILAGASFAAGVAALSLADAPYPHPWPTALTRTKEMEGSPGTEAVVPAERTIGRRR